VPRIAPVTVLDPGLTAALDQGVAAGAFSSDVLPRIWARRPELAGAQIALHTAFYEHAVLEERLLELARLRIAAINDCHACRVARKSDTVTEEDVACLTADDPRFTPREQAAIRFAELFALDHSRVDVAALSAHLSEEEVVELGMFCALMLGSGRLAHVLEAWDDPVSADRS
jgi:alkylhydroperoxidase family enzyme